jgi:hypothetical protein
MIKYLKNLIANKTIILPFRSMNTTLSLTRITEKFDVVERVPVYTKIKYLNP